MERMLLHLTSGADQEAAIEQLLAAQSDPTSPSYHQWVTPAQFGQQFGVSQADQDAIAGWLESQGFTVNSVAAGRRSIEFSGTANQVEQAFHTEMHRYRVNGVEHVANSTDISIPSALVPVVGGVVSLHNFGSHPLHKTISRRPVSRRPLTDLSSGSY
jgi:subtilase family serine protease